MTACADILWVGITQSVLSGLLSSLTTLRIFRMHLDWPDGDPHDAPFADVVANTSTETVPQSVSTRVKGCHIAAARIIAPLLGPKLEYVELVPFMVDTYWQRYRVIRNGDGRVDVVFRCRDRPYVLY